MLQKIIPSQRFELIRDAIGRVLTAEFASQKALVEAYNLEHATDEGFIPLEVVNVSGIYAGRENTIDQSELPIINIILPDIQYNERPTSVTQIGDNKFFIEVYASADSDEEKSGDIKSSVLLERISGMVRAILMNDEYNYLDFSDKFIRTREITSYTRTRPRIAADANNTISGTLEIHYYAEETTELQEGHVEALLTTVVKLENTEKGYKFIIQQES